MKQIVLIVGASGVGKDTLLKNLQNKIQANFVTRYITRKPDENENNYYIDEITFEKLKKDDFFISTWEAHNNKYAIAKNQIKNGLNIISISRGAIKEFEDNFKNVTTIEITLPKEILYKRLKNRARENEEEIQKRLNRSYTKIEAKNIIQFDNSDSIEQSTKNFITLLERIKNESYL
ncbi:guanylate kinase/L-type calcium channel region [Arcobacter nitrofigilis DSM 7299]|uniref:Guanylate kinase/L-type calcium channel region n=1 Tax=Arcobacter nitrofigilis (strain ATCC 33309 / DSM 7299 / CCUG 15893 / LMG 7604 / NCTC 12251 / CI) TaxID=572480 RepID=D5V550_ARCNC|nr:AAA family ATPase [Arcobacter nitrofigilis]ADG92012.1 guanylate kinase/L-type calcium channel region [Arcobacter nitrofigilis DSM 7299]